MSRLCTGLLIITACLLFTVAPASADVIFSLDDVTLSGGSTLTGTFTTNDTMTALTGADLTVSADGTVPGFTYTFPGDVLNQSLPTQYLQLDEDGNELRLAFNHAITSGFVDNASYDDEGGHIQTIASGQLVEGVPEPSTVALLGVGLLYLGVLGLGKGGKRYFDHVGPVVRQSA